MKLNKTAKINASYKLGSGNTKKQSKKIGTRRARRLLKIAD